LDKVKDGCQFRVGAFVSFVNVPDFADDADMLPFWMHSITMDIGLLFT